MVEVAEHVVERPVLERQHHHVVDVDHHDAPGADRT
jgi:hypothetical protein